MEEKIIEIINDLEEIDKHDVYVESIKEKLLKSLNLYKNIIAESVDDITFADYSEVIQIISKKYSRYEIEDLLEGEEDD